MSHLWWRTLDHQINFWDVETTSCHIGGHQNLKRAIPEAFQCGLSLFLRNVSVEGLGTLKTEKKTLDNVSQFRHSKSVENMFERQINMLNFQYYDTPMGNTFLYFTFISNTVIVLQMYACTCLIDAFMESSLASFFVSQKTIVLPWLPLYTWITSPMTAARWDQWHAMARCYRRNDRPGRDVSINSPATFLMMNHYISTFVDDDKCFHF